MAAAKPVVLLTAEHPPAGVDAIATDNVETAAALAGHLLDHGVQHLRFAGDPALGPDIELRYRGFVRAHEERRRVPAEPLCIDLREHSGHDLAERLIADEMLAAGPRPRPRAAGSGSRKEVGGIDALMCANDELALSVTRRLRAHGVRVPTDLAVTGWDDVMTARYVSPGLTTVRQPVRELGALAAERLHERVLGAEPRTGITVLPTEIVLRGSCGCTERD